MNGATGWREATVAEYNNVTATPHAEKRHFPGQRVSSVEWTFKGHKIAEKVEQYKRGKVVSTSYMIDPAYLT